MPKAADRAAFVVRKVTHRLMKGDTIAAIATPPGTGGISIVKISGPDAVSSVSPLFRARNAKRDLRHLPSQRMVYGHIYDPAHDTVIDEVLVTVLRGPHSYTGEDVVEVNCHGGGQVTGAVMELLLEQGIRIAKPGEFTRRAFLNGRLDLTQVEGTIDLIHARTRRAARAGSRMLVNGIGDHVRDLRDKVIEIRAHIEAAIDFCDDGVEISADAIHTLIRQSLIPRIDEMLAGYREGLLIRDGLRVVLAGKPNVGKSSLMNRLLRRDRMIVTDIPGTTRDTIAEGIEIDGIPVLLSDTAGLRNSNDPIERIGHQKAKEAIDNADLVLVMTDASCPMDSEDYALLDYLHERPYRLVRNKIDLVPEFSIHTEDDTAAGIPVSALNGQGIDNLKQEILSFAGIHRAAQDSGCPPNLRQKDLLSKARHALSSSLELPNGANDVELAALDLKDAEGYLSQVLGVDVEHDVLDDIFNRFCIGK